MEMFKNPLKSWSYDIDFLRLLDIVAPHTEITSDASKLSSALLSSDSARAGGFSARLGSAREIFEPARLAKIGLIRAKTGKNEESN